MSICCEGRPSSSVLVWLGLRGAGAFLRMLSSASLLFILKSGCLNSHACKLLAQEPVKSLLRITNARAVLRLTILLVVVSHFVEIVLVELANETGEVAVLEVLRQDVFCEFFVLCDR